MDLSSELLKSREQAITLARRLAELGAESVVALDVSGSSPFTDCFVIAGAQSTAQMRGYRRRIFELIDQMDLESSRNRKRDDDGGWLLIDCTTIIIHIMLPEQREFYDLEKLWFDAERIFDASAPINDV